MLNRTRVIYGVIERTDAPDIRQLAAKPGCKDVHRVICYYGDASASHSVATLIATIRHEYSLSVIHENRFGHRPLTYNVSPAAYETLTQALTRAHFDRLADQPENATSATVWMLERVAGTFHHSVLLCPDEPEPPYSIITNAIDDQIPEAVRKIQ